MKITGRKSGLIIGAITTGVSLLLTATLGILIISVVAGVLFEIISENLVNNAPLQQRW